MNLPQLVKTMHNICKVWGSNPRHHQKKLIQTHPKSHQIILQCLHQQLLFKRTIMTRTHYLFLTVVLSYIGFSGS